ncbi:hypothetical protein [uncultured Microscilla sp.]|uniref:hypothetical protein n=1 Tax=uncultured Microscilla sp. TaxID=432653 RepID=UPI0026139F68|nr:hypothetical protein [uncultured Microscilla sp.]
MKSYTRMLVVAITLLILATLYAAASQGWWVASFRNTAVIHAYQKEQRAYGSRGVYGKSGRLRNGSRSFRGGSRRGGK